MPEPDCFLRYHALQRGILLRRKNPTGMVIKRPSQQRRVVLRRRNTVVGGKCALPSDLLVLLCIVSGLGGIMRNFTYTNCYTIQQNLEL